MDRESSALHDAIDAPGSVGGVMPTRRCAFCDIATGQAPATVIESWPRALAFTPRGGGVAPGHTLVVPRTHVRHAAVDPLVSGDTMAHAARLARRLIAIGQMPGANIITSIGRVATQSVFHLHIHLVPRHDGDRLCLPWTGQTS